MKATVNSLCLIRVHPRPFAASLFSVFTAAAFIAPLSAQTGNLDGATCTSIYGWAYIDNYSVAYVDIYDGATLLQSNVVADLYRADLQAAGYGTGYHGFSVAPPSALLDHKLHQVYVKYSGTSTNLPGTPQAIQCAGTSLGYTYYLQSTFADPGNWNSYGNVSISNNMFTSSDPSGNPGMWISGVPVPDGSSNYEVRTILSLKQSGGTYITYLRATGNPMSGGSGVQVALSDPQFSGGGCTATLSVNDVNNGSLTNNGQWTVACADGMEIRSVVIPSGNVLIMIDGWETWSYTSISSGQPGVGAIDTPANSGLTLAALGPYDSVAPGNVDSGSVATYMSVSPTGAGEVDMSWTGVPDNPNPGPSQGNGVGVWYYVIYRDGSVIGTASTAEYADAAVNAGETHTYQIFAQDWHGNVSTAGAVVSVTLPPAGSVNPRRVGVQPTGNYWGAMGEQIDTQSNNLNFSISLLTAMGRGGWSVPVA